MSEEVKHVPPASPMTKSRGGDKRTSFESPRSSSSRGKVVPHHLRSSSSSLHDVYKHGKPDDHVSGVMECRPWRKPVVVNGRVLKEIGVDAVVKKTAMAKPKPSGDCKIQSPSKGALEPDSLTTNEPNDVHTEQSSAGTTTMVIEELGNSEGPETNSLMEEMVKHEMLVGSKSVIVPAEEASLNIGKRNLLRKSSTLPKVKPLLRSRSAVSSGSSTGKIIDERKSVDGKKVVERSETIDGRKGVELRKSSNAKKDVKGKKSSDAKKGVDDSTALDPEITQKCDVNASNVENNNEGSKRVDEMKSIEENEIPSEKKGDEDSKSLNLATNKKDSDLGNAKNTGIPVLLKKHVMGLRPKVLTAKPSPFLNPSTLKPPSALQPSRSTHRKTSLEVKKFGTSKMDAKKVIIPITASLSSNLIVNEGESAKTKKVRVVRVVSSVKRPSEMTKVAAKNSNDQGVQKDTADVIKTGPERKSLAISKIKKGRSNFVLPLAPSVSKSTVRPRISNLRLKKLPGESEQKIVAKDATASGLRKGKAIDLESEMKGQNRLKVASSKLHGETVPTNRRSYLRKRDMSGDNVPENNLDNFLQCRPIMQRKKNVSALSNKAIAETANKLIRTKRSKVLALIGAFETVISIHKKSVARIKPRAKKISSSTKTPR